MTFCRRDMTLLLEKNDLLPERPAMIGHAKRLAAFSIVLFASLIGKMPADEPPLKLDSLPAR